MCVEMTTENTLKNIIDMQYESIQKYHSIMMMQEAEIAKLKERIKELEADK